MDNRYKTEAAAWVAYGLNRISADELAKAIKRRKTGKLSKQEILEITRKDCARGADGLPVMVSAPKKFKL